MENNEELDIVRLKLSDFCIENDRQLEDKYQLIGENE
jgi:hypothetical protein